MKRILFSLMVLAAVLSVAGVGSLAYFSDIETSKGNTFEAGTWVLDINIGKFEVVGAKVGDTGTKTWTVTNVGSVPAYLDLENISLTKDIGQLSNYLMIHLFDEGDIYGTAGSLAPIKGIATSYDLDLPLKPSESSDIALNWEVINAYVPIESDRVELTIFFELQAQP